MNVSFQRGLWDLLYVGYAFDPDWVYFRQVVERWESFCNRCDMQQMNAVDYDQWVEIWTESPWDEDICVADLLLDKAVMMEMVQYIRGII